MCAPQYHWDRRIDLNCKGICYTVERAMYLSTSVKYAQMDLSRPKWLLIVSFTLLPRSNLFKLINSKRVGKNSKYCYLQYILANIIFYLFLFYHEFYIYFCQNVSTINLTSSSCGKCLSYNLISTVILLPLSWLSKVLIIWVFYQYTKTGIEYGRKTKIYWITLYARHCIKRYELFLKSHLIYHLLVHYVPAWKTTSQFLEYAKQTTPLSLF